MAPPAGSVELVDAALASYPHSDLKWLVRRHVLDVLFKFPSLSPSVDTYTSDDGASAVLLNAQGLLAVSSSAPPLHLTVWVPKDYPHEAPIVYVLPAQRSVSLVPDHPFVDHHTGRVLRALPSLRKWRAPSSNLTELARTLVRSFRMCHPFVVTARYGAAGTPPSESPSRRELLHELAARLISDSAAVGGPVDDDIDRMSLLHGKLRARGDAMEHAVRELGEERMQLEGAVTANIRHRDVLLSWLQSNRLLPKAVTDVDAEALVAHDDRSRLWVESKASELAAGDAMDALGDALEKGVVRFEEYMKHVRVLAREQFFHCHRQRQLSKKTTP